MTDDILQLVAVEKPVIFIGTKYTYQAMLSRLRSSAARGCFPSSIYFFVGPCVVAVAMNLGKENILCQKQSTLIACTGKITQAQLTSVPTPPATATRVPVPHLAVVEGLVDTFVWKGDFGT